MPIRHCIAHLIGKKPDGTPAVLHARDTELAESAAIQKGRTHCGETRISRQSRVPT
jgi:nucleoid-associated protein